jgi:hypothetical protein
LQQLPPLLSVGIALSVNVASGFAGSMAAELEQIPSGLGPSDRIRVEMRVRISVTSSGFRNGSENLRSWQRGHLARIVRWRAGSPRSQERLLAGADL